MSITTGERCVLIHVYNGHNTICAVSERSGMDLEAVLTTVAALALAGHVAEPEPGVWAITLRGRWAVAAADTPETTSSGLRGIALLAVALAAWVAYLFWAGDGGLAYMVGGLGVVGMIVALALVLGSDIGERVRAR